MIDYQALEKRIHKIIHDNAVRECKGTFGTKYLVRTTKKCTQEIMKEINAIRQFGFINKR